MEAMNEPIHHHYLSVFYLSRWEGSDGRICRFSRPYGDTVKAGRVAPKGTAFEPRLYETKGLPPEHAQIMETDFMAKIDNDAANALTLLEKGSSVIELSDEARNSWSRFLVAQMLRTPRDISQLKSSVEQVWNRVSQPLWESYAAKRSPKEPATLEEFWAQLNPAYADELALSVAHWCVLDVPEGCDSLLTSDNPVWMTATLVGADDFLLVAIGPRRLFVAAVEPDTLCRIQAQRRCELVKIINKITVQHADRFVYGKTEDALPLVQEHMSTRRHDTWLERHARMRDLEIVASDNPPNKV
jgi:hypothetical protein